MKKTKIKKKIIGAMFATSVMATTIGTTFSLTSCKGVQTLAWDKSMDDNAFYYENKSPRTVAVIKNYDKDGGTWGRPRFASQKDQAKFSAMPAYIWTITDEGEVQMTFTIGAGTSFKNAEARIEIDFTPKGQEEVTILNTPIKTLSTYQLWSEFYDLKPAYTYKKDAIAPLLGYLEISGDDGSDDYGVVFTTEITDNVVSGVYDPNLKMRKILYGYIGTVSLTPVTFQLTAKTPIHPTVKDMIYSISITFTWTE